MGADPGIFTPSSPVCFSVSVGLSLKCPLHAVGNESSSNHQENPEKAKQHSPLANRESQWRTLLLGFCATLENDHCWQKGKNSMIGQSGILSPWGPGSRE